MFNWFTDQCLTGFHLQEQLELCSDSTLHPGKEILFIVLFLL